MDNRAIRLAGLAFFVISALAGCASAPTVTPSSEAPAPTPVEQARADIRQAQAAGYNVDDAVIFLRRAEQSAAAGDEKAAATEAEQARHAVEARKAIEAARPEVQKAMREAGPAASDAGKLLEAAEAALKAGDPVRASELAAQARRQAADAEEQHRSQAATAAQAEKEKVNRYRVVPGDTLWAISGKSQVYGEPLLWPLLFRGNRDRIKTPDRIFPGQGLTVDRNPAAAEKHAAVHHARTRGPWRNGAARHADSLYLGR